MSAVHPLRRAALTVLILLLAAGCARSRPEKRILVYTPAEAAASATVGTLRQIGEGEGIIVDTTSRAEALVEDSLARYSAVVFLQASGDSLTHRQQADVERYVQSGGGVVVIGAQRARTWPWFDEAIRAEPTADNGATGGNGASTTSQQAFDGGRVFHTTGSDFGEPAFREALRDGLRFAIGRNRMPDYRRVRTERVPESTRFQQEILVQGDLDEPTEMAITRDGRVFIAERKGALRLFEPSVGDARRIARLPVTHEEENGFIGLTLDPRFDENGWIYVNYSVADTLLFRVSRFTFTGEGIADEKVLLEVPYTRGCCHTGGSMTFDGHGNLLVSFGDNSNPFESPFAPLDPTPGKELWDARRSSANTRDLRGKIVRITPQPDGTYVVPEGNLFPDAREGRPEIYTMGHRNPYRISVDRRTGYLYWGEVGPDARADSTLGPKGYDEVNQARRAGNFGWPMFIADNQAYRDANWTSGTQGELFDARRPVNDSPNNTGAWVLPPAQPAFIWYPYDRSEEFPLVGDGGRNAMAGPVYYYDDYPDSPTRLPRYYHGKFIHYDWMRGWMMAVTMDEQGDYVRMEPFLEHLTFDHPMDVELGPDGSLYVLEYGTYWFATNPTARLSRITFQAGNRPPVAALTASDTVGAAPFTVHFSGEGSYDHDGEDALRHTWTFADDATSEGPTATHTFTSPGSYTVRLVVQDASGAASEAATQILVGNAPPEVRIVLDGNRSFFWDREPISYRVEVRDAEDGTLGRGIDPQQVRVGFDYHPEGTGGGGSAAGHQVNQAPRGLALIQGSTCLACHGVDQASIGPSFRMVAERYAGRPQSVPYLIDKIIQGGSGVWGEHRMSAHPDLPREDAETMVRYILSLRGSGAALPAAGAVRLDRHRPGEAGAYVLSAAYADQPRNGVGPLRTEEAVVLRSPLLRAADIADSRSFGMRPGPVADGAERPLATAYADSAYLRLGPTDLTGVGAFRFGMQALQPEFTVELRSGGPAGTLLGSQAVRTPARDSWFEAAVPVDTTGEHDLYIVLRTAAEGLGQWNPLVRIDAIRVERATGR